MDKGVWVRPDYYDQGGGEYRSLVGIPGGMNNTQVLTAMRNANVHNLTLRAGHASDSDTFSRSTVAAIYVQYLSLYIYTYIYMYFFDFHKCGLIDRCVVLFETAFVMRLNVRICKQIQLECCVLKVVSIFQYIYILYIHMCLYRLFISIYIYVYIYIYIQVARVPRIIHRL